MAPKTARKGTTRKTTGKAPVPAKKQRGLTRTAAAGVGQVRIGRELAAASAKTIAHRGAIIARAMGSGSGRSGPELARMSDEKSAVVRAMGMEGISKSQVSRLCAEIDEGVQTFLNRPIEGEWPYVWLDATYVRARRDHHIVSVAVIVAVGVNTDGRREVLGMTVGNSEAEPFWAEFLRGLARRGLRGVKLVVSDAHEGLKVAIAKVLGATWQRCRVHFMRNAMAYAGKTQRRIARPGSAPPLRRTMRTPPASSGAKSPIRPGPGCLSSPT